MTLLAVACLYCAALPAAIFCLNLRLYQPPPPNEPDPHVNPRAPGIPVPRARSGLTAPDLGRFPSVSILIPARNEEPGIAAAVAAALASTGIPFEVIVMDDSSTDSTAEIVRQLAASNPALRLEQAPPLPTGWNGKQHACWTLANTARHDLLCFVDADVRLSPEAVARMAAFLDSTHSSLVSGFPRQLTVTWLEQLLLPLIHFILLGFLPLSQMRRRQLPAYAAGCGQFLLVERAAYFASGGHAAIRATMHDGIKLPRLLRAHGFRTDLADLTPLATCRMYTNAADVWNGLAKNATEGMAAPATIVPATLFLVFGQVLPFVLLALVPGLILQHAMLFYAHPRPLGWTPAVPTHIWFAALCASLAAALACLPRLLSISRFRQPVLSAMLHPLGILTLLALQWYALARSLTGAHVTWKSRAYTPPNAPARKNPSCP